MEIDLAYINSMWYKTEGKVLYVSLKEVRYMIPVLWKWTLYLVNQ